MLLFSFVGGPRVNYKGLDFSKASILYLVDLLWLVQPYSWPITRALPSVKPTKSFGVQSLSLMDGSEMRGFREIYYFLYALRRGYVINVRNWIILFTIGALGVKGTVHHISIFENKKYLLRILFMEVWGHYTLKARYLVNSAINKDTVHPRSINPFYIVTYCIKWVPTSWTDGRWTNEIMS